MELRVGLGNPYGLLQLYDSTMEVNCKVSTDFSGTHCQSERSSTTRIYSGKNTACDDS